MCCQPHPEEILCQGITLQLETKSGFLRPLIQIYGTRAHNPEGSFFYPAHPILGLNILPDLALACLNYCLVNLLFCHRSHAATVLYLKSSS
jgi:hypothetical protein